MQKKIYECQAFLSNMEVVDITYESEKIRKGMYINKLILCIYKGVDISPVFGKNPTAIDIPNEIYAAVENNAVYQWEQKSAILAALGL